MSTKTDNEIMNDKELERYSRQIILQEIGYLGQQKLRKSTICVMGAGGLGSPILVQLAAMGVGTIRIVDCDYVEESNLHRQTIYGEQDIRQIKVAAAAERIAQMNPGVKVEAMPASINDSNADLIISGCDVVIDALDTATARRAVNRACLELGIPFVTSAAIESRGLVYTITGQSACYDCVFGTVQDSQMPTCSTVGVFTPVLSIVGSIAVSEAVRIMLGKQPRLENRIQHVDLDTMSFPLGTLAKNEDCIACGAGKHRPSSPPGIRQVCGRNHLRTFVVSPKGLSAIDLVGAAEKAVQSGYSVESCEMGLHARNGKYLVTLLKFGAATIIGPADIEEAREIYLKFGGII